MSKTHVASLTLLPSHPYRAENDAVLAREFQNQELLAKERERIRVEIGDQVVAAHVTIDPSASMFVLVLIYNDVRLYSTGHACAWSGEAGLEKRLNSLICQIIIPHFLLDPRPPTTKHAFRYAGTCSADAGEGTTAGDVAEAGGG